MAKRQLMLLVMGYELQVMGYGLQGTSYRVSDELSKLVPPNA